MNTQTNHGMYSVISDKNINYPASVLVWILSFLLLLWFGSLANIDYHNKFLVAVCLIVGGLVAFGDTERIEVMGSRQLLLFGVQTGIWVEEGFYFLFIIFSFDNSEPQSLQTKDIVLQTSDCQDMRGKWLKGRANGDWEIGDHDKFKKHDETKMPSDLQALIERFLIKISGQYPYKTKVPGQGYLLGQDLGALILADVAFVAECDKYGIYFINLFAIVVPSDLKQENINAYADELMEQFKSEYPVGHTFTPADMKDIRQAIQVQLGAAKRIITESPTLARTSV